MGGLLEIAVLVDLPEGTHDIRLSLHSAQTGGRLVWSEVQRRAPVGFSGQLRALLGRARPLPAGTFNDGPLWLEVRVADGADLAPPPNARLPLFGTAARAPTPRPAPPKDAHNGMLRDAVEDLLFRMRELEQTAGVEAMRRRLETLEAQLEHLLGDTGRVGNIEAELRDIVGADGDVVDLNDRMDQLERQAPALRTRLDRVEAALAQLQLECSKPSQPVVRAPDDPR